MLVSRYSESTYSAVPASASGSLRSIRRSTWRVTSAVARVTAATYIR